MMAMIMMIIIYLLIDVEIPSHRNLIKTRAENKLKYKYRNSANLEYEMLLHKVITGPVELCD